MIISIDKTLEEIKEEFSCKEIRIKFLERENKRLKDEAYKDSELQSMKMQFERMQAEYYRGFPISESEDTAIKEWMEMHDRKAHGLTNGTLMMKAGGCIGGRYSYHFTPTSIGTSGVIRCSCGAEFEFQEIG